MKAINLSGQAPGGKRTKLADVLPLDTPYLVQIFPIYACNFKCGYCIFSVRKPDRHFIADKTIMDFALFKRCVGDMANFPDKIKVLRFVGIGEPLLHKNLVDMVKYAVDRDIANTVEILTNGSLLTPSLSDSLIASGLSRLVISLQGITAEKYEKISGVKIDIDSLKENLSYFYGSKKETHLYIKIVDTALDTKEDEEAFFHLFGDICDTIGIEYTVPIHTGVAFEGVLKEKNREVTQFGIPLSDVNICPQPFFHMQINPDGKVVPCYSFEYPEIIGDCNYEPVNEIWMGEKFQNFRRRMLEGLNNASEVCENCNIIKYRSFDEDLLYNDAHRLKPLYEC
jgi:radical SAM protein with 4Fe4S-binding SPASM domain